MSRQKKVCNIPQNVSNLGSDDFAIEIENLDPLCDMFVEKKKHQQKHQLAPQHPFRCLVVGPSGGGKSNLVMNLVLKYLCFDKLYIYAKDLKEEKYLTLIGLLQSVEKEYKKINECDDSIIEFSSELDSVSIEGFDGSKQNLVIFDDMITESKQSQKVIDDLFVRGRKTPNCSLLYLTQSYFNTPTLLKKQCNYIILLNVGSKRELIELAKTYATDIDFDEFVKLYKDCTAEAFSFMTIDLKTPYKCMKYRCGLDKLYTPCENGEDKQ